MDEHTSKILERVCELIGAIFGILWGVLVVIPVAEDTSLDPIKQLTQIILNPYFFLMVAFFIASGVIFWSRHYKGLPTINPETLKKALLLGALGFLIAIGLGIGFVLILPGGSTFLGSISSNKLVAYLLGSGVFSLNAISPFLMEIVVGYIAWSAFLTWLITGLILGILAKRWRTGIYSGLVTALLVWLLVVIGTRLFIRTAATTPPIVYAGFSLFMLVNAGIAFFVTGIGSTLGSVLYAHVSGDKAAIQELEEI
ncbi:MAG: hypothetical protein HWN66_06060 [Candidatus Helarchaeota archaeon]|nr:hypothetical protein [Candidatus Helarchaeota archaeon]